MNHVITLLIVIITIKFIFIFKFIFKVIFKIKFNFIQKGIIICLTNIHYKSIFVVTN